MEFRQSYSYFCSFHNFGINTHEAQGAWIGGGGADLDEGPGEPAGDGAVGVKTAFAGVEVEDGAREAVVAAQEPVAPFGMIGEDARFAREILGELPASVGGALSDVRLDSGGELSEAGAEADSVLGGDGERAAATLVATGTTGQPVSSELASVGKGRVDCRKDANFPARVVWRDHLSSVLEIFSIFSIFALFYGVAVYGWMREGLRERRRAQILDAALPALLGQDIHRARELMGEPSKIEFGMSGRRLYIWRPPATLGLPETPALTVVTLTVEANDIVSATSWKAD